MKKSLAKKVTLSILAGAVLMSSSVVWARDIIDVAPGGSGDKWVSVGFGSVYVPKDGNPSAPSASNNKVVFNSGFSETVNVHFAGGYSNSGAVEKNTITIDGGTFDLDDKTIYGGLVENYTANASYNEVVISGVVAGSTFGAIYGGAAGGDVEKNRVTLSAGNATYKGNIYGGESGSSNAIGNTVTISGGKFDVDDKTIYGGYSGGGNAKNNEVVISNVEANSTIGFIAGGEANNSTGVANYNRVTLSAGNAKYVGGVHGGYSGGGSAEGNTVTISDGTFDRTEVNGGYSDGGDAEGNIVTISGGTFSGTTVHGGYSDDGSAKDNTVNISGTVDLSSTFLSGGYVDNNNGTSSDNVLNVGYYEGKDDVIDGTTITGYKSWTNGNKVRGIRNFQEINFKNIIWENTKTVLDVDYDAILTDTTIGDISIIGGTVTNGEYMNLISANSINGMIDNNGQTIDVTVYQGVANKITLEGKLEQVDSTTNGVDDVIKLTINDTKAANGITAEAPPVTSSGGPGSSELNPQVLVIGESRTAATAFTNQGSELIETGLDALARDNSKDTKVFAAVYGNHSEYETGSHVNVNGWSGIVGVGKTNANGLTIGAFFENGDGNYSTHNVTDFGYLRGDGEAVYNGGGFLVRKDNASGVYTEASLRAGNLKNELRGAVIGSQGEMGYDIDTFYYGAHIGVGKIIARGADGDSLDVYGKFIYTHHDGEDFKIDGDEFKFDSVDSERLRVGFRLNEVNGSKATMYYGAAWEYEFGGDADNKVVGYDLSTPSLEGSTVIGEVGMHYKASDKWSFDLNARAYTGQREGFSGSVQANYSF